MPERPDVYCPMSRVWSAQPTATMNWFVRLTRLLLAVLGGMALVVLLQIAVLDVAGTYLVQAAPPLRPLTDTITGTITVQHTSSTSHRMVVFGDGKITNYYLTDNGRNQIDQDGKHSDATTIAIRFHEHAGNVVDVGADNDFYTTTLVTLNDPSIFPGYSEDSQVVYASKTLSYQITQQTLSVDTQQGDWLIMELTLRNTGDLALTDGKLLFMLDIDAAHFRVGDEGGYDPDRQLVYQADDNKGVGYAMGVSLLEGDLEGYGIDGKDYPGTDTEKLDEMTLPKNSIKDGNNDVSWLVVDLPTLSTGQETKLSFGLCAKTSSSQNGAIVNMINCIDAISSPDDIPVLKIVKDGPAEAHAGDEVEYTFTVSHDETSNGAPLHDIYLDDSVIGPVTNHQVVYGDSDSLLEAGEIWVYTAGYTIPSSASEKLVNTAIVEGQDPEDRTITAVDTHELAIIDNRVSVYLPSISANGGSSVTCSGIDAFTSREQSFPNVWPQEPNMDYDGSGHFRIQTIDPDLFHIAPLMSVEFLDYDYSIETDVYWQVPDAGAEYGLVFAMVPEGDSLEQAYRLLVNSHNGNYRLDRHPNLENSGKFWETIASGCVAMYIETSNSLKIEQLDNTIRLHINDFWTEVRDDDYVLLSEPVQVGLGLYPPDQGTVDARFDNFRYCYGGKVSIDCADWEAAAVLENTPYLAPKD